MDTTRRSASSGSPYESTVGFSRAVRVGPHVAVSGTAPINADGHVSPDPAAQARRCWEIALAALSELGGEVGDVVRTRHYITHGDVVPAIATVHGEVFADVRPASTMVMVGGLIDSRWVVEVELDAIIPEGR
jgi:enamine deaminase RidA (YjgF/YER057c/UK114 family)